MAMQSQYVRGTSIVFSATFTDQSNNPLYPSQANLTITYFASGVPVLVNLPMTIVLNSATVTWDSSVSDAAWVDWCVKAIGIVNAIQEGGFTLIKNTANPGT